MRTHVPLFLPQILSQSLLLKHCGGGLQAAAASMVWAL